MTTDAPTGGDARADAMARRRELRRAAGGGVIEPALRSLLPPEVAVVTGPVAGLTGPLFQQEQAAIARALPKRVAEFTAGRIAARRALAQVGVTTGALERGPGGIVLWPAGATGSISHGGGMVAAVAVAQTGAAADIATLGVDLEPLSDRAEGLADTIATADEADAAGHGIAACCASFRQRKPRSRRFTRGSGPISAFTRWR